MPSSSSCSDSDGPDNTKPLLRPPASETASPPAQQKLRPWQQLERDCNVAMKALARAGDVDRALALFAELRSSVRGSSGGTAHPSVLCYNTLFNALAEAGRMGEAVGAFDEMLAAGVAPNVSSLNILVKLHAWRSARFDLAYEVIIQMQKLGVAADIGTYSTLITGLCRVGKMGEAWGVLEWMLEEGCRPMVHTYTPIVQGYCREGRVEEAKELMEVMERAGCPPNVVTYNILIKALCGDGRFDETMQVLKESTAKGWKPSTVSYNTFMNGLCKKGMAKEAFELLDVMLGEGLDPTECTLSICLKCLCHESRVSDAIYLLQRSTAWKLYAGVVAYSTVMSRLCEKHVWMGVLKLLTDMIKKGIMPNARSFNILIRSLCIGGKFSIAKSLVQSQGFSANVVTYNILIHWFFCSQKIREVKHLILDMKSQKIAPDEITYTTLVDGFCRERSFSEATDFFLESLEIGLSRDIFALIINRLVHNDKLWEIDRLFGEMRKHIIPDYYIFEVTIRSFCRTGFCRYREIYKLNFILDTMLGRM